MRKKISTTVYITPEQNESLKLLSKKTRVPVAEYIREGVDLLLGKYSRHIPGYQPVLPLEPPETLDAAPAPALHIGP